MSKMIKDETLESAPEGVVPKGVVVKGLNPEHGKQLAALVAAVSVGEKLSPRISHDTYEGGFDDSLHFLQSLSTRIALLAADNPALQVAAQQRALRELAAIPAAKRVALYRSRPDLDAILAERAVRAEQP